MKAIVAASLVCATIVSAIDFTSLHYDWEKFLEDVFVPQEIHHATFDQFIDHNNPSLGTFEQHYWYNTRFWDGPGSPVIFTTPGEVNATAAFSLIGNETIGGMIAKEVGGMSIMLEHRYWGDSTPFGGDLSTESLQYLTIENSIKDFTNFAMNVELPFATSEATSNADAVPWVFYGGSYPGALAAWTASVSPGTFWTYLASSATVEAVNDNWRYVEPIQEGMPVNCSKDAIAVVEYMDNIFMNGTEQQQTDLIAMFGAQELEHFDDFMFSLTGGPGDWQEHDFAIAGNFYSWCDTVEGALHQTDPKLLPGPDGVGLDVALAGWASYYRAVYCPTKLCSQNAIPGLGQFDSYNTTIAEAQSYNSGMRQWIWLQCNEMFGQAPSGPPDDEAATLFSRLIQPEYFHHVCASTFAPGPSGETFGIARGVTPASLNSYTGGWDPQNLDRVIFTLGEFDPWREITVGAKSRPGGPLQSTARVPVNVIPGGIHCSDFRYSNAVVNDGLAAVQQSEIEQVKGFLAEWPTKTAASGSTSNESTGHSGDAKNDDTTDHAEHSGSNSASEVVGKLGAYIINGLS